MAEEALQPTQDAVRILQLINDICTQHVKSIEPSGAGESWADIEERADMIKRIFTEIIDITPNCELWKWLKNLKKRGNQWDVAISWIEKAYTVLEMGKYCEEGAPPEGQAPEQKTQEGEWKTSFMHTLTKFICYNEAKVAASKNPSSLLNERLTPEEARCILCAVTRIKKEGAFLPMSVDQAQESLTRLYPNHRHKIPYLIQLASFYVTAKHWGNDQYTMELFESISRLKQASQTDSENTEGNQGTDGKEAALFKRIKEAIKENLETRNKRHRRKDNFVDGETREAKIYTLNDDFALSCMDYINACRRRYLTNPQWLSELFAAPQPEESQATNGKMQKWTLFFDDKNELSKYLSWMGPYTDIRNGRDWDISIAKIDSKPFLYVYGSVAISLYSKLLDDLAHGDPSTIREMKDEEHYALNAEIDDPDKLVKALAREHTPYGGWIGGEWKQLGDLDKQLFRVEMIRSNDATTIGAAVTEKVEINSITRFKQLKGLKKKLEVLSGTITLYDTTIKHPETASSLELLENTLKDVKDERKKTQEEYNSLKREEVDYIKKYRVTFPFDVTRDMAKGSQDSEVSGDGSISIEDPANYMQVQIICREPNVQLVVCIPSIRKCLSEYYDLITKCMQFVTDFGPELGREAMKEEGMNRDKLLRYETYLTRLTSRLLDKYNNPEDALWTNFGIEEELIHNIREFLSSAHTTSNNRRWWLEEV